MNRPGKPAGVRPPAPNHTVAQAPGAADPAPWAARPSPASQASTRPNLPEPPLPASHQVFSPTALELDYVRRRGRGLMFTAVLLATLAAVLGYYTVTLWQGERTASAKLKSSQQKVAQLESAADKTEEKGLQQEQLLEKTRAELAAAQAELTKARDGLDVLRSEKADADAAMRDFREVAARFQRMIDSGRLKVKLRRGRMVVDLPAQVLFASGSAELSDEGTKSLREVARVLRKVRGKRFIVGGHTDTVKIDTRKSPFSSNWALSAARAVTVTEALLRFGLHPKRLVAAGYGPHDPVASNRSAAGRQENRRIEIILEPKLRELPDRLEDKL